MRTNDEPAFPNTPIDAAGAPITGSFIGMSLRDYFAAKVIQGMAASEHWEQNIADNEALAEPVARTAYYLMPCFTESSK